MATTKILANKFKLRADLEEKVRGLYGLTTDPKDAVIEGTQLELKTLQLKHQATFWGIPCRATDQEAEKKKDPEDTPEVPNRGKVFEGGINLEKKDQKKLKKN